ncbi:uncharacterized protein B0I36DRAFT_360030 [Microdochium trichocladiopsis]|uniref:Uncharacterized protein n=1 Tax=Microdochium trichocladiopsis TaxID=1682393 RepID=A0A9P9BSF3_9PEZI|nr:uncharacterized protein B0I36DRAFT_360030 [Microdochium trichocladiopsis]KAH7034514.1 hypothetical protein B0I36DRAFT_360030 [Microdochium trichocladiopsis]
MVSIRSAAALLTAAAAQASAEKFGIYMPDTANVTGINAKPNATAVVPVPGWNLAKPYPGYWNDGETVDNNSGGCGWTMHLNLTANVSSSYDDRPGRVMRQSLELRPPAAPAPGALLDPETGNLTVSSNTTDTWLVRFVVFSKHEIPTGGQNNADGSCAGILSQECTDNMRAKYTSELSTIDGSEDWEGSIGAGGCPISGWAVLHPWDFNENFMLNNTLYWDEPLSADNKYSNAYDFYGSRPVPYAIIWGHSNTTAVGQRVTYDHVTIGCIKANETVGDSRLPSAGVKPGSAGGVMMWAVTAATAAAMGFGGIF